MLEVQGSAPARLRWSRRGLITAAGLAFVCFITVTAVPARAALDYGVDNSGISGIKVPTEDQVLPLDSSAATSHPLVVPGHLFQVCPVDRPRSYIDSFGFPRAGHRHQGNDIMSPRGTPIRAPFDGTAKRSDSGPGGLGVYVYGNRGFVFNAHLSRLGKMGKVKAGDIVGYVGNSGNARGGSTHDHFEWHPRGGKAVSPFRFLYEACRGGRTREKPPVEPVQARPAVL
jgi:murein DD-endopeptidase MepM/ murein hydrolase activator NlpD